MHQSRLQGSLDLFTSIYTNTVFKDTPWVSFDFYTIIDNKTCQIKYATVYHCQKDRPQKARGLLSFKWPNTKPINHLHPPTIYSTGLYMIPGNSLSTSSQCIAKAMRFSLNVGLLYDMPRIGRLLCPACWTQTRSVYTQLTL